MRRVYRAILVGSLALEALLLIYIARIIYAEEGIRSLREEWLELADMLLLMLIVIPIALTIGFTPYAVYWVIKYKILKRKRKKSTRTIGDYIDGSLGILSYLGCTLFMYLGRRYADAEGIEALRTLTLVLLFVQVALTLAGVEFFLAERKRKKAMAMDEGDKTR